MTSKAEVIESIVLSLVKDMPREDAYKLLASIIVNISSAGSRRLHDESTVHASAPLPAEEVSPPQVAKKKTILVKAGQECSCIACNAVVFKTVKPIYDTTTGEALLSSLAPVNHDKKLTLPIEFQNIDGNVSINCPVCGGDKTLYIIGRGQASA